MSEKHYFLASQCIKRRIRNSEMRRLSDEELDCVSKLEKEWVGKRKKERERRGR